MANAAQTINFSVTATSALNKDLNNLIKYYLEFKPSFKLFGLIQIDESNGLLSLNMKYRHDLLALFNQSSVEFYVNAMLQCALNQKAMFNQTLVRINFKRDELIEKSLELTTNLTSLIETRALRINNNNNNSVNNQCIKLNRNNLMRSQDNLIALAQLQIIDHSSSSNQHQLRNDLFFVIEDEIKPPHLSFVKLEIQYLVDNIYIVYLVRPNQTVYDHLSLFMNNLVRLNLKVFRKSDTKITTTTTTASLLTQTNIFLCFDEPKQQRLEQDTDLFYELSLLQFNPNMHKISAKNNHVVLASVHKLTENNSSIRYFIDYNGNEEFAFDNKQVAVNQISSNSSSDLLELSVQASSSNKTKSAENVENLMYELILVAYDQNVANRLNINVQSVYEYLKSIALESGKFLPFTSKILVSNLNHSEAEDLSIQISSNQQQITFYTLSSSLLNNSVIGHLPYINQLDLSSARSIWLNYDRNLIQNFYYDLEEANEDCYRLDKYDGTLYLVNRKKFANCSRNLTVNLEHNQIEYRIENFARILIQDLANETETLVTKNRDYLRINSNPINLVYNLNEKLSLVISDGSKKFLAYNDDVYFELNFDYKKSRATLPKLIRLANLISKFGSLFYDSSSVEYKTEYEMVNDQDLFFLDNKKNAIYLNTSHLNVVDSESCGRVSLRARNFIYINSMKRKLISQEQFLVNICFLNGEIKQNTANNLLSPVLDLSTNYQYLIHRRSEQNLIALFKNDLLSFVWYVVIVLFALGSLFLVSVLVYLNFSKKISNLSGREIINRSLNNGKILSTYSSSSTSSGFNNAEQLKIRNDISRESEAQSFFMIMPNKLDLLLNNQPLLSSLVDGIFSSEKEESISEDQGVYCVQTGVSSSPCDSVDSNISSVTNRSQCETHQPKIVQSLSSFNEASKTKLSLFEFTPTIPANSSKFINKSLCKNKLILSPPSTCMLNEHMQQWILTNYSINHNPDDVVVYEKSNFKNDECII